MDREASGENREIKVDSGEASQAERNSKKVKLLHAESMRVMPANVTRGWGLMTNDE
jgi:hypothetical protein